MKHHAGDVLRLFTPELPEITGDLLRLTLANQVFLENCADRLTILNFDGGTRLKALEAVTMSLDGLTYRLTLKKGLYFHCGAEVTANDAVATILHVLKCDKSASQLHRHVARDRSQRHGFAVKPVSRYRFEISLTRRLQDLLARLSLPELGLRHEGRACFSGLWRIAEQDSEGLLLAVHDQHVDAATAQYKAVRWERLREIREFATDAGDVPYLYLYPGTACKSPPEELLTDEICRTLDGGLSFLIELGAPGEIAAELKGRLVQATRASFGRNSLWRRAPLTSLVPKGHVLHSPFHVDVPGFSGRRLALTIVADDAALPSYMWEKLRRVAADDLSLDLEVCKERSQVPAGRAMGTLRPVFYGHPADSFTPVAQLGGTQVEALLRTSGVAPFLSVPFVVRSNRTLRKADATGLLLFSDVRQSSDRVRGQRMQDAALRALGAGLQMFVHDVKRPFSMMQGVLGLLEAAQAPARLSEITGKYLPDVRRAVDSVGRLIQDILEIGSDSEPNCEDVSVVALIDGVLRETFSLRIGGQVELAYKFRHSHKLNVDPQKMARVVSNIVLNAVEAMHMQGKVWFETSEAAGVEDSGLLTLVIGNSNSYIPEELLKDLFSQFFTEGKKHGTGLGLAIVKKIVSDHGGDVWCESDRTSGTRFLLKLPVGRTLDDRTAEALPLRSDGWEVQERAAVQAARLAASATDIGVLGSRGGLTVLLVDDDPLYAEMVQELLTPEERTRGRIRFQTAPSCSEALALFTGAAGSGSLDGAVDVAIVDVDLGRPAEDGIELVRRLRALGQRMRICVHSSGPPFELQRRVIEAGGDLFLAKPMARDHLLRLLLSVEAHASLPRAVPSARRIAIVDDDALALETWEAQPGYTWLAFSSPAELLHAVALDPGLLASLACVVTDYTFPSSADTGVTLADALVKHLPDLPVFLATDRPTAPAALPKSIRAAVAKEARQGLAQVERYLAELLAAGQPNITK